MTTIPDTMRTIARDVQSTFEELVKLLLRKTLRPTLNPLGNNSRIIYNTFKGKYERGLIGSLPEDNINKYSYIMTHESLGWIDDNLANFRVLAKFIKNSNPQRFPSGYAKIRNTLLTKSPVAYSDKEIKTYTFGGRLPGLTQYKNFLTFLTSKNMQSIIANKKASFSYAADIPYTHSFKQLENIGKDIIDQTDPSISGSESAKMSTAMLRVKLYNLEHHLAELSVNHPNIYDAYIEMLRIINSNPKSKMVWIINLIATLSYQSWDELTEQQQCTFIEILGEDFICAFNDNELITILLQSGTSEIILTSSYLYPLLKMLFIAFGYSRLVPAISDKTSDEARAIYQDKLRKHFEKYRGASFRRGDGHDIHNENVTECANESVSEGYESEYNSEACPKPNPCPPCTPCPPCPPCPAPCEQVCPEPCNVECEPLDPCLYDFIKLFGDLYPTIIGLMGGTESFPPENIEVSCFSIPSTYDSLASIPEYLWRFNDFSYCRYIENVNARQLHNAISSKVNAKVKYLHTI